MPWWPWLARALQFLECAVVQPLYHALGLPILLRKGVLQSITPPLRYFLRFLDFTLVNILKLFWSFLDAMNSVLDVVASTGETDVTPQLVISFGPSGFLGPYYVGVAEYFKEHFECDQVHACGVSGGYAGAASIALRVTPDQHWRASCYFAECVQRRRCGALFLSTSEFIHAGYLPVLEPSADAVMKHANKGLFHLGVTQLFPWPRSVVVNEYKSLKELIYVCTCSKRSPPFYRMPGRLHGKYVLDGALTRSFVVPQRCNVPRDKVLTVSVFPRGGAICPLQHLGGLSDVISPRSLCDRERFNALFQQGYSDAHRCHDIIKSHGFQEIKIEKTDATCMSERSSEKESNLDGKNLDMAKAMARAMAMAMALALALIIAMSLAM